MLGAVREKDALPPPAGVPGERFPSVRTTLAEAFPWLRTPRGRLVLYGGILLTTAGGGTALRGPIRGWLDVPSRGELAAADDRAAQRAKVLELRVEMLEQRLQTAREGDAKRSADVHEAHVRALQEELRRASIETERRPTVMVLPADQVPRSTGLP